MCTNFVPTRGSILNERFGLSEPAVEFREEAYPGYLAPMIRRVDEQRTKESNDAVEPVSADGLSQSTAAVFGLIPGWSRDGKNYRHCYNARSETVGTKPSFRNAWRRNQFCIVPVQAFYEPSYETGSAQRWRIQKQDGTPMGLAAIWDAWRRPAAPPGKRRPGPTDLDSLTSDWVISFSLLTINADKHPLMKQFHRPDDEKRSVVILEPSDYNAWLDTTNVQACDFLHTLPASELEQAPAPKKPRNSRPELPAKPIRKLL